jgi:hypothetical protein
MTDSDQEPATATIAPRPSALSSPSAGSIVTLALALEPAALTVTVTTPLRPGPTLLHDLILGLTDAADVIDDLAEVLEGAAS